VGSLRATRTRACLLSYPATRVRGQNFDFLKTHTLVTLTPWGTDTSGGGGNVMRVLILLNDTAGSLSPSSRI
jgi:hypothetical protein